MGIGKFLQVEPSQAFSRPSPALSQLRKVFKSYGRKYVRAFPWRAANVSPFKLLVAELLLIQTDAPSVAHVWPSLVRRFGSPKKLSQASSRDLVRLLRRLGLQRQRTRALKAVSKEITSRFGGQVPSNPDDLLSIPHLGLYTAAAMSCFKFGARVPIVDANTLRIFERVLGIQLGKDIRRSEAAWSIAWRILPKTDVILHNYGMLDFAAQICTSKAPRCVICPVRKHCQYAANRAAPSISNNVPLIGNVQRN